MTSLVSRGGDHGEKSATETCALRQQYSQELSSEEGAVGSGSGLAGKLSGGGGFEFLRGGYLGWQRAETIN